MKVPDVRLQSQYPESTGPILQVLSQLSLEELTKVYRLTEEKAKIEKDRLDAIIHQNAQTYPAYQLFNGLMYRYIDRQNLTKEDLEYYINHVYITSSLYGIIPFNYPIAEHRLDFQTKIKIRNNSLKSYWRPYFNQFTNNRPTIVSLLSSEFEEVFSKNIQESFLKITFMEDNSGQLKIHSTISKKGRGAFLSECMHQRVESLEDLKHLTFDNFSYSVDNSSKNHFVYIKKEA